MLIKSKAFFTTNWKEQGEVQYQKEKGNFEKSQGFFLMEENKFLKDETMGETKAPEKTLSILSK